MKQHTWSSVERSGIRANAPGLAGIVLGCTLMVAAIAVAGASSNRDAALGVGMLLTVVVLGGILARMRAQTRMAEIALLATRDPLTGLANRRVLDETLPRELARARRTGAPLSAIVLDVDHFKGVNDRHGHQAGDAVLRSVGAALEQNTKGYDVVVRLGGDEFAVLLPGCCAADAAQVAERLLLRTVSEVDGHPVTLSAGHATLTDDMVGGDELLAAADTGLYAAKRSGRSRAATAQDVILPATTLHMVQERRTA